MTPARVASAVASPAPALWVLIVAGLLLLMLVAAVVGLLVQRVRRHRHDVEAAALAERLRRDAHHDPLTGLPEPRGLPARDHGLRGARSRWST